MKKNYTITAAVLLVLGSACRLYGQAVTLGDTSFEATSDQISTTWFMPMVPGTTVTFEGVGANAGETKTERYSVGEAVAGVKTIKRNVDSTSTAVASEEWWLARDIKNDLRVLRVKRAGAVSFEASPNVNPPLFLPETPTAGRSWDLLGTTITVEWVAASGSGSRFKITETVGLATSASYYLAGNGIVRSEAGAGGAAWSLTTPLIIPVPESIPDVTPPVSEGLVPVPTP